MDELLKRANDIGCWLISREGFFAPRDEVDAAEAELQKIRLLIEQERKSAERFGQ